MRGARKRGVRGVRGVRRLEGMVGEIAGARPGLEAPVLLSLPPPQSKAALLCINPNA